MTTSTRAMVVWLLVAAVSCLGCATLSLEQSSEEIAAALLEETPIGSSKMFVRQTLEARGLTSIHDAQGPPSVPVLRLPFESLDWASYLRVDLGWYSDGLRRDVVAFFVFDQEDQLLEVQVQKYVDAL